MTRQCKNCIFESKNKLRKVIKDVIVCIDNEHTRLEVENAKLKEKLAEANQLKNMYHTYYRAKHDDIKGIIFKQKEKLEKIKELCQVPNEPYYNSECEFGKGRIDLGQEILEIIRGEKDEND